MIRDHIEFLMEYESHSDINDISGIFPNSTGLINCISYDKQTWTKVNAKTFYCVEKMAEKYTVHKIGLLKDETIIFEVADDFDFVVPSSNKYRLCVKRIFLPLRQGLKFTSQV